MDLHAAFAWTAVNILLAFAAWRAVRRADPVGDFSALAVHAIVTCWGVVIVTAFILGATRILDGASLLLLVAVFAWTMGPPTLFFLIVGAIAGG